MANPDRSHYRDRQTVPEQTSNPVPAPPSDHGSRSAARHFLFAGLLALALYAGGFALDQYLRHRRGPWEVTFATTPSDQPSVTIRQPALDIREVTFVFPGWTWTNTRATVRFDQPRTPIPFGRIKHEDLTSLPGVVTLELFGHEIELLPRTLFINRQAVPWHPKLTLILPPEDAPGALPEPRPPSTPRRPAGR